MNNCVVAKTAHKLKEVGFAASQLEVNQHFYYEESETAEMVEFAQSAWSLCGGRCVFAPNAFDILKALQEKTKKGWYWNICAPISSNLWSINLMEITEGDGLNEWFGHESVHEAAAMAFI